MLRETVGWLARETKDYVVIVWDRPAKRDGKTDPRESGLVILKSTIVKMEELA